MSIVHVKRIIYICNTRHSEPSMSKLRIVTIIVVSMVQVGFNETRTGYQRLPGLTHALASDQIFHIQSYQ
ncbi:hypothetical protein HanIR_Chr15g0739441 [Helianthus annuus]|nr:hypothetical protein HanIR_Chr15g0739441 [Helianthus annuus]